MSARPQAATAAVGPAGTLPRDLPGHWHAEAARLRRYGCVEAAETCEMLSDQLVTALAAAEDAALTLAEASVESGFTSDHLRHLVASGAIPNVGRRGAPRLLRRDLPTKARASSQRNYDALADAIDVRTGQRALRSV